MLRCRACPDTRDLGAIVTRKMARHILPKKASAQRSPVSYQSRLDKELLMEAYNLKAVIDLRFRSRKSGKNRI